MQNLSNGLFGYMHCFGSTPLRASDHNLTYLTYLTGNLPHLIQGELDPDEAKGLCGLASS